MVELSKKIFLKSFLLLAQSDDIFHAPKINYTYLVLLIGVHYNYIRL